MEFLLSLIFFQVLASLVAATDPQWERVDVRGTAFEYDQSLINCQTDVKKKILRLTWHEPPSNQEDYMYALYHPSNHYQAPLFIASVNNDGSNLNLHPGHAEWTYHVRVIQSSEGFVNLKDDLGLLHFIFDGKTEKLLLRRWTPPRWVNVRDTSLEIDTWSGVHLIQNNPTTKLVQWVGRDSDSHPLLFVFDQEAHPGYTESSYQELNAERNLIRQVQKKYFRGSISTGQVFFFADSDHLESISDAETGQILVRVKGSDELQVAKLSRDAYNRLPRLLT